MTKEHIEDYRKIVLPFVKKRLLEINYENLGEFDAEEFEKDFNEILDMAIKALEQIRWIPVSERLPEADGRYLCTYEDDIEENCVDFGSYENGEWYVDKVIAWMPLPEPYKEEGSGEE